MSDLVKRLRDFYPLDEDRMEAADRIEQLERELAEASDLIAQIKGDIRDTEDEHRSEVEFSDHLKSQLAAEKALADRLYAATHGGTHEEEVDAFVMYCKARGL